jgi:hypothetical protein
MIKLNNGEFLLKSYGKYSPNLTFVLPNEDGLIWGETHAKAFNLDGRHMSCMVGDFWTSLKGTNCFKPKKNGRHILVYESWGGGGDRGDLVEHDDMLYFRRASSNGGGTGNTYAVLPVNWKASVSVDDI